MSTNAMGDGEAYAVEFSSRALVKLDRAAELFASLEQAVDRWNEEHQLMAPARSPYDGDQRLEFFRPSALDEVPRDAWESTFHDGVHNLRVALDTFCFELCYLEQPPPEPGAIHFPITEHPNDWSGRTKHLSTIPVPVLERIRECQAWERPDPQARDPLKLISRIDKVDKHRAAGVTFDVIPMVEGDLRPGAPLPQELVDSPEWQLIPWMEMIIDPPFDRGRAELIPVVAVPILMFEGLFANLPDAQRWLHSEVWRAIVFIASGEWPEAGPEPTWLALPGPDPS